MEDYTIKGGIKRWLFTRINANRSEWKRMDANRRELSRHTLVAGLSLTDFQ